MLALPFPAIDPIFIEIGPFAIRWYALAYITGILLGWRYCIYLNGVLPYTMARRDVDDLIVWITLGIIAGGRLGYVVFYNPAYFVENPAEIVMIWRGGMSFHGGFLGVLAAIALLARQRGYDWRAVGDMICSAVPIGLFFGRIANFINGELFGRASDAPWAMVFPYGGPDPRHPSQLYEAALEGLVLFVILFFLARRRSISARPGRLAGLFVCGYAISRFIVEFVREPDAHLGFLFAGATMGQLLSAPMFAIGLGLILLAPKRQDQPAEADRPKKA